MPSPAAKLAMEMPKEIAALLPKARRKPLPLSCKGKTAAFLVSARDYENMEEITERALCCDKIVDMYAEALEHCAKKDGTLDKESSLNLMAKIAEILEAEEDRWCAKELEKVRKNGELKSIGAEASRKLMEDIKKATADIGEKTSAAKKPKRKIEFSQVAAKSLRQLADVPPALPNTKRRTVRAG